MINVTDIAARTKVCTLTQRRWQAIKLHKAETRDVNGRHSTVNTAKVLVRITDHPALSDLTKLHAAAYAAHKTFTLPTVQEGMRLLPVGREMEHAAKMTEFGDKHNALVRAFLADYDDERTQAPVKPNGLYDPAMWPNNAAVAAKFAFKTQYLPTPTTGAWSDWLTESSRAAQDELRDRLTEALTRVRDRCRSDGRLFATVFDSIRELTDLAPDLDFTGTFAPVVSAMTPLTTLHSEQLRDDEQGRKDAAAKAQSILSVLGGIK